jgi:uncharacterized membrane protein YraQ (UPF0718 family)
MRRVTGTDTAPLPARPLGWLPVLGFAAIAIGGLWYVKWHPYYGRAFVAAARHSIGGSIVSGTAAAPPAAGWQAGIDYSVAYIRAIWQALLLGLALGAGVQVLLPRRLVLRLFAGRGASARAAGAALPSMMCTCCAAPVAVALIRSEADAAAALAYWLANPVLNPATLVFMGFVLGWGWAGLRLVLGAALVFALSHLAARLMPAGGRVPPPPRDAAADAARAGYLRAYATAFWRLAVRLVPEYLLLVFALGAARAWLFPAMTPVIGHAAWLPPLLAAIGTLFVIPTAGEVPIVQVLQHVGLGTAGAAALLLTLPAVSLPSLAMLGRAVPLRVLAVLGVGTFGFGLAAAYAAVLLGLS